MHVEVRRLATGVLGVVLAAGATAGCSGTTTEPTIVTAIMTLTGPADPIVVGASSDGAHAWETTFSLDLAETGGVAATIIGVSAVLQESAGGIVVDSGVAPDAQIQIRSATNELAANGSLPLDFTVHYTLPGGGREAVLDVAIAAVDANGLSVDTTLRVDLG